MDDRLERLAGIFYAYKRLMYELDVNVREFDISDPWQFAVLRKTLTEGRTFPPPQTEIVEHRNGEFYEQFEAYGLTIRCHVPGERQRREIKLEREIAERQAKKFEWMSMPQPMPTILTQADIDRLGLADLEIKPGGIIGRKKQ